MASARARTAQHASHRRWLVGAVVTCAALVVGYAAMLVTAAPAPHARRFDALVDAHGARFASQARAHDYKLVVFGYTSCADVCPASLSKVRGVLNELGPADAMLVPLFVTLDPARDTLPVLSQYVTAFDPRIVGLTGSPGAVQALARSYGILPATATRAPDAMIGHSAMIYLLGRDNRVLGIYGPSGTAPAIAADVQRQIALSERVRGGGATA